MGKAIDRRKHARDEAIASARLEGEEMSTQAQDDLESYVQGELTLEEIEARTLARYSSKGGAG